MRSASEIQKINRFLQNRGMGKLDDPGLIPQMAFLVQSHAHFRSLLIRAEPEHRRMMYDALAPKLRFPAKSLEDYLGEGALQAEKEQLPGLNEKTGELIPFEPARTANTLEDRLCKLAEESIAAEENPKCLRLHCSKCTYVDAYWAKSKEDAIKLARKAGWFYEEVDGEGREICPRCPAPRPEYLN